MTKFMCITFEKGSNNLVLCFNKYNSVSCAWRDTVRTIKSAEYPYIKNLSEYKIQVFDGNFKIHLEKDFNKHVVCRKKVDVYLSKELIYTINYALLERYESEIEEFLL
jgi:hypothetical protein